MFEKILINKITMPIISASDVANIGILKSCVKCVQE